MFRKVVCLCGSTRFGEAYTEANLRETLAGRIVLTIGCNLRTDMELFSSEQKEHIEQIKLGLDELHLDKIAMSDEILVLNVGGYVGKSTIREIAWALCCGVGIRWLEEEHALDIDTIPRFRDLDAPTSMVHGE
jgi:hypothetical protein